MKTVMTGALALALMAGTAGAALAQDGPAGDHDRWHDAGERPRPPQRSEAPRQAPPQQQAQPQQAPRAEAPRPQAQAPTQSGPGGWQRGPDGRNWRGPNPGADAGRRDWNRPPAQQANPAPATSPPQASPDRRRWEGERRDDNRRPPNDGRWDRDQDRRGWDRDHRDDNRRDWDRRDWDRDHRGWDNRQDRPRYDPRNYPRSFHSQHRYRTFIYRPPPGFYARSWVFGDILPRAWWTPDYRLDSWWDYGLPIPPIGYEWVRVGDDALLVDMYSGRVVQVVYDVFW